LDHTVAVFNSLFAARIVKKINSNNDRNIDLPRWGRKRNVIFKFGFFPVFEEPEDPTNRSFFSEIISSISDVKFSNSGRYMISRDYLSVKVWDLHMETKPIETYTVKSGACF
jgi:hypothetical protein